MVEGYIYKLVLNKNLNDFKKGEIYVGKHNGVKKEYFGSGKLIKILINKYSTDIFDREILAVDINNDELLSYLERYYISFYNCNRSKSSKGLNLTNGGEGIFGFKKTKNQCEAISKRIKQEYLENKRRPPKEKIIHQYDKITGKYIKSFDNAVIACKEVNGAYSSSISYAARDVMASAYGFMWSYRKMEILDKVSGTGKAIKQFSKENTLIAEYKSALSACRLNGWNPGAISNCLRGRSKTAYGFIFKYKT